MQSENVDLIAAQGANDIFAEAAILQKLLPVRLGPGRQHSAVPIHIRLLNRVRFGMSECWNWCGPTNGFGYGRFSYRGKPQQAHRVSFEAFCGPIPDGLSVLHRCDNRACINPDHLWLGTYSDNLRDAWAKGRNKGKTGHKGSSK